MGSSTNHPHDWSPEKKTPTGTPCWLLLPGFKNQGDWGHVWGEKTVRKVLSFFPKNLNEEDAQEFLAIRELLALNPGTREFNLVYGSIAGDDREIAILTRSMIEITAELAARVEVPAKDIAENRASPGLYDRDDQTDGETCEDDSRSSL